MLTVIWIAGVVVGFFALAYVNAAGWLWTGTIAAALAIAWGTHALPPLIVIVLVAILALLAIPLNYPPLRRKLISDGVLAAFRKILPPMTSTEREAIEAGTVGWDGELFSGRPDWKKLLALPPPRLTAEEQSFLEHECEEVCGMVTDWETTHIYKDLPPAVWQYIKDKGFLGMIIPKEYGGLGFSALAHSQVVTKLASRCSALVVTVMVPNSLGPGELLRHYGTDEQKRYYLPRLAKGQEIPCFALTNPHAGSDAAAIPDAGIVCRGDYQGKSVLGLRLNWEKRYITLGPVATLLGLAFRAFDPEHLLGDKEDLGITCALIPTNHPGVNIGRRHMPLSAVFQNGPNWGKDVFIPLDWVIGGQPMVGKGWRMLMECLAAGRAISLPSLNTGMAKMVVRATGGYARVRSQFKTPIGKFEGVEEPLARMGGYLYSMDATRTLTAGMVDLGEKPAVLSAIGKYHLTERGRQVAIDAMDIAGGKGICMGPTNFLGAAYMQIPVSITVEGANILTRSLIIFGQGAIRCHPFVLKEMAATREPDAQTASLVFDRALFGHIGFVLSNFARTIVMGIIGSRLVPVPDVAPETHHYYQQLTRFSAALAFLADVSMGVLGGALKRKEKLSARLGDVLSYLFLCSTTLKRFEDEGRQREDAPLMHWAIWDAMFKAQTALEGVISNFPNRLIAMVMRRTVFPLGRPYVIPSDKLGHDVARLLIEPSATRDRLTAGMYQPQGETDIVRVIESAVAATLAAEPIDARIREAQKAGRLTVKAGEDQAAIALAASIITADELTMVQRAKRLVDQVIRVDDFAPDLGVSEVRPLAVTPAAADAVARKAAA
ncbi:MAG TPA: acyl-CoA dehydrogenase [Casimicrobiaceae bacterium]|jgi:acyl-CoA dehydrogenase|nr:acyl-CoA dehydrogenase [Casimicrobiaceae bacterium]